MKLFDYMTSDDKVGEFMDMCPFYESDKRLLSAIQNFVKKRNSTEEENVACRYFWHPFEHARDKEEKRAWKKIDSALQTSSISELSSAAKIGMTHTLMNRLVHVRVKYQEWRATSDKDFKRWYEAQTRADE